MIANIRGEDFDITYRNPKVRGKPRVIVEKELTLAESLGLLRQWLHST